MLWMCLLAMNKMCHLSKCMWNQSLLMPGNRQLCQNVFGFFPIVGQTGTMQFTTMIKSRWDYNIIAISIGWIFYPLLLENTFSMFNEAHHTTMQHGRLVSIQSICCKTMQLSADLFLLWNPCPRCWCQCRLCRHHHHLTAEVTECRLK